MQIRYDAEADILRILLSDDKIYQSDETAPGLIVDYTKEGKVVGIELLDASESVADPYTIQLNVPRALAKTAA